MAAEEKKPPCSRLYIPDKKSLLFEVTYYENRINFEVFHALTDGTGAMIFLLELVQNYLILAHPDDGIPGSRKKKRSLREIRKKTAFLSIILPRLREKRERILPQYA